MSAANFPPDWTRRIKPAILERDRYLCQIRLPGCTVRAEQVDHIKPRSMFHPKDPAQHDFDNLRAACAHCNQSRGSRIPSASRRWYKP